MRQIWLTSVFGIVGLFAISGCNTEPMQSGKQTNANSKRPLAAESSGSGEANASHNGAMTTLASGLKVGLVQDAPQSDLLQSLLARTWVFDVESPQPKSMIVVQPTMNDGATLWSATEMQCPTDEHGHRRITICALPMGKDWSVKMIKVLIQADGVGSTSSVVPNPFQIDAGVTSFEAQTRLVPDERWLLTAPKEIAFDGRQGLKGPALYVSFSMPEPAKPAK